VLGLAALELWRQEAEAIVLGLMVAAVICASIDARLLASPFRPRAGTLNQDELARLLAYAWPMVAVAATAMILQNSDRFLLGSLAGPEMLGIFAVAYNLVDRPTAVICSSISTATFPLAVQVLERDGREAARIQAGRNGIALLAVALPACVGLALVADHIAAALIGPAFRPGVAALLPIMSFAALCYGPATVANIALNLYVVPRYGMFGAAWTALACQVGVLIIGWFLGTSLFPIWLPFWQVVRCVAAIVPMTVALLVIPFPLDWYGLVAAVLTGAALYVASAMLLDVGDIRSLTLTFLKTRVQRKLPALTDG
jgi:O-antigen/teichoic acid export membrane protein